MRYFLALLLLLSTVLAASDDNITLAGSTTVLPIAQATAEAFMDKHPEINISVRGGGSSVGIASLISGNVEIGNASRHIKNKEVTIARQKGVDPVENVVANDGIAMCVNNQNGVMDLTMQQLQDIYSGKITNWKKLGGKSMPIVIISRDVSSGTFEVFNKLVMKGKKIAGGALILASNNAVVTTIKNTPGAIGYAGLGYVNSSIKAITVNGVKATVETVQNKSYPIARTLHMYTAGTPSGLTKQYLDFVLSNEGQEIVSQQGFVKVK